MIVPRHWDSVQLHQDMGRKSFTVRRWGWSDTTPADAKAMAQERAEMAMDDLLAGRDVHRLERKVAYNGADGAPIREEILREEGTTVITRNAYGAWCLNTPNVLFADIDLADQPAPLVSFLGAFLRRFRAAPAVQSTADKPRQRIDRWMAAHPDWRARLYETPKGLRLLVLHDLFDPQSEVVATMFAELGVDPLYARMCRHQQCFRARLTPKPWRIGVGLARYPRHIWPVEGAPLADRKKWVARYEAKSKDFAACRFVAEYGNAPAHPDAEAVRRLHDELSGATTGRPIA